MGRAAAGQAHSLRGHPPAGGDRAKVKVTTSNLEQGRPIGWQTSELFSFIEECWNNSLATVGNRGIACQRLSEIDELFLSLQQRLKPAVIDELVPALLFMRAFVSYRASIMVLLSLPTDGFPLLRSSLEYSGYALLIRNEIKLAEVWLQRDDTEQTKKLVRDSFTLRRIRSAISSKDEKLSEIYQGLYERTIDWGAHPNEKALTPSLVRDSFNRTSKQIQFKMLGESGASLEHALRTAAQVGVCAIKIFTHAISTLSTDDTTQRIEQLSSGL
ncbi:MULTISPECIES: hypothetical protein [Bradyrhizobium]|jgi:hypothetical protein|uniref:hypothetical protein n=1 Tax=Bradyrhizobium elkanii TaxID=29448 RepID=UPI002714F8CF|nr:hypothetical protein [Bradyrhizobium elkanii]WLA47305.1 hypothetical protein QIH80_37380 [Bradyrhizobium elkanii]WLB82399.1 hypothetical protein QIH83_07395 [Bradyrhizobium elkanii]